MEKVVIRAARETDIPGICHVNRGEPGPWAELPSCATFVHNRINNGFYVQVAQCDGRILAHAEWIVSDEYRGRIFYLGQLQVDPDFQYRGIGREMLADGIRRAKKENCARVSLIPELETGSQRFYAKCGFLRGKTILHCALPAEAGPLRGKETEEAPHVFVRQQPFVFGLTQTAAEHMWQVYNRRYAGSTRSVYTLLGEDFCIQLGGFDLTKNALLLAWADGNVPDLIRVAQAFAWKCGYPGVNFYFFPEQASCFPSERIQAYTYEMLMELHSEAEDSVI